MLAVDSHHPSPANQHVSSRSAGERLPSAGRKRRIDFDRGYRSVRPYELGGDRAVIACPAAQVHNPFASSNAELIE